MAIAQLDQILATAASATLEDWGQVGLPLSDPPCTLRGIKLPHLKGHAVEAGIWECSPGRYRRQVVRAETMHILSGTAVFKPDHGEALTLQAGDVFFFDAQTHGEWEIQVALRKVYLMYDAPG
ncbi:MAG: cupin domain-containing protein [Pseudomonadota bacterium]